MQGQVGLAILKSLEAHCDLNLRPGAADDVVTQIVCDLQLRVEGH